MSNSARSFPDSLRHNVPSEDTFSMLKGCTFSKSTKIPAFGVAAKIFIATMILFAPMAKARSEGASLLPGISRDHKFERYIAKLDLEDTSRYKFHYKSGGTSLGFKISRRGKRKKALFLAHSGATVPEGEVVSYRLSRLTGVSRLFNPVDYYELGPKAVSRFRAMYRRSQRDKWRRINLRKTNARLARQPNRLFGIVKYRHKRRSQSVNQLSTGVGLNTNHVLAKFLKAGNSQPPAKQMRLYRVRRDKKKYPHPTENAAELARQLSIIFVVDMLTEQWDRFSGGNIEVYAHKSGRLQFVARDNGGAGLENSWVWFKKYASWVSRFDRKFVKKLKTLNEFLQGRRAFYGRFQDVGKLKVAMGFRRIKSFGTFKKKLRRFIESHLAGLERRYGERIYFAPVTTGKSAHAVDSDRDFKKIWIDVARLPQQYRRRKIKPLKSRKLVRYAKNRPGYAKAGRQPKSYQRRFPFGDP